MTILHLGVLDIPYAYTQVAEKKTKKRAGKKSRKVTLSQTTGDVAEILEAKYGLMETFFEVYEEKIVKLLTDSVAGALESFLSGSQSWNGAHTASLQNDPYAAGAQQINELFKQFILSGEAERISIPGTPTKAALRGVSHRKAHPYAKHERRPSFYDTGMYVDHFVSWVD